jgi:hypothetical protein
MVLEIDLSVVPPGVVLRDVDDFTSLSVALLDAQETWISTEELAQLAGPRSHDDAWRAQFDAMLTYAESRGWLADGAVRAHIDWPAPDR